MGTFPFCNLHVFEGGIHSWVSISFERHTSGSQFVQRSLKLRPRDANRIVWRWVGIVGNAKESGNIAQSQVPGTNTEIGLGISRYIDYRAHESGTIQHSPGSNHPGTMGLRRAE